MLRCRYCSVSRLKHIHSSTVFTDAAVPPARHACFHGLVAPATTATNPGHSCKLIFIPAGAASGMVGIAAGQPLDTLRVRLQQRGCQQNSVSGVWKDMARAEGVRGLFRGMSYPIYTTALQVGTPAAAATAPAMQAPYCTLSGNTCCSC